MSNAQNQTKEYGVLVYDVPSDHMRLYHRLHRKISRQAIRVNLSVYLFPWGLREGLERIVAEAHEGIYGRANVKYLKFDASQEAELLALAKESLRREVIEIGQRLRAFLEEARNSNIDTSGREYRTSKKLDDAEALAVLFGISQDIEDALKSARAVLQAKKEMIKEAV